MAINFDDQSTGISYQQYPKDPAAREQIEIVDNKLTELKEKVVSKQEIINLENKVKQSGFDNENKIAELRVNVDRVEAKVDGLDGGNLEKIEELESAVNNKADKNVVDSLLNQIEGSVKQINGNTPDENGNVIIDVNTEGLATIEEVTTKTDELAGLVFSKAEKADVETLVTQVASKASAQSVTALTSQLAETVKEVNGAKPVNGVLTIPIPQVDTTKLATKTDIQQLSLTFKESYATLAALQTAYPTGDNANHTVLADNMIYTYKNGWISTGIQATGTGLANGTVTADKFSSELVDSLIVLVPQVVDNGDFANGKTGWTDYAATGIVTNGVLASKSDGSGVYSSVMQNTSFPITTGKRLYLETKIRATYAATSMSLRLRGTVTAGEIKVAEILNPTINEWYTLKGITTIATQTGNAKIQLNHSYPTAMANNTLEVEYVTGIDLDVAFGVGKTPTQVEIDSLLAKYPKRWFPGKVNLFNARDVLSKLNNTNSGGSLDVFLTESGKEWSV